MEKTMEKKGFSWMGLLFGPYYYAGYGNLKKGGILAVLSFMPLTALAVNIHCGIRAKKELPVGEEPFAWKNVAIIFAIFMVIFAIVEGVFGLYSRGM